MFVVETLMGNDWENCWTTEPDDEPEVFATKEEAQEALEEFLEDVAEAGLEGYDRDEYRITEIEE